MFSRSATRSNVASSATEVRIVAENNRRQWCVIVNDSSSTLYLGLGGTAVTSTDYSFKLAPGDTLRFDRLEFNGEIRGIWSSANGYARVTEVV